MKRRNMFSKQKEKYCAVRCIEPNLSGQMTLLWMGGIQNTLRQEDYGKQRAIALYDHYLPKHNECEEHTTQMNTVQVFLAEL